MIGASLLYGAIPWRPILIAGAFAATFGVGWHFGSSSVEKEWLEERGMQAIARAAAESRIRVEEQRRVNVQSEIASAATAQAEQARVAARTATASADRLRQRVATLAGQCSSNSAASGASAAASSPGDLLADVQRRLDGAAGEIATHADSARIAGRACERAYESLRGR